MLHEIKTISPLGLYIPLAVALLTAPELMLVIETICMTIASCIYILGDPSELLVRSRDTFALGPVVGVLDFLAFGGSLIDWVLLGVGVFWFATMVALLVALLYEGLADTDSLVVRP